MYVRIIDVQILVEKKNCHKQKNPAILTVMTMGSIYLY